MFGDSLRFGGFGGVAESPVQPPTTGVLSVRLRQRRVIRTQGIMRGQKQCK